MARKIGDDKRPILPLTLVSLRLPKDPKDFLAENPEIGTWTVEGARVFDKIEKDPRNVLYAYHACLTGWFQTPLLKIADPRERIYRSAQKAGLIPTTTSLSSMALREDYDTLTFSDGSVTLRYLSAFLNYQKFFPHELFTMASVGILRYMRKVDSRTDELVTKNLKDVTAAHVEFMKAVKWSIDMMPQIYGASIVADEVRAYLFDEEPQEAPLELRERGEPAPRPRSEYQAYSAPAVYRPTAVEASFDDD